MNLTPSYRRVEAATGRVCVVCGKPVDDAGRRFMTAAGGFKYICSEHAPQVYALADQLVGLIHEKDVYLSQLVSERRDKA